MTSPIQAAENNPPIPISLEHFKSRHYTQTAWKVLACFLALTVVLIPVAYYWIKTRKIDFIQNEKNEAIKKIEAHVSKILGPNYKPLADSFLSDVEKYVNVLAALRLALSLGQKTMPHLEASQTKSIEINGAREDSEENVSENLPIEKQIPPDNQISGLMNAQLSSEKVDIGADAENEILPQPKYDHGAAFFQNLTEEELTNPGTFSIDNIRDKLDQSHKSDFQNYVITIKDRKNIEEHCESFITRLLADLFGVSWSDILKTEKISEIRERQLDFGIVFNFKVDDRWINLYLKGEEIVLFDPTMIRNFLQRQLEKNAPDPDLVKLFTDHLLPKDLKYLKWTVHSDYSSFTLLRSGDILTNPFEFKKYGIVLSLTYQIDQQIKGRVGDIEIQETFKGIQFTEGLHLLRTEKKLKDVVWPRSTGIKMLRGQLNPYLKTNSVWSTSWDRENQELHVDVDQVSIVHHKTTPPVQQKPNPLLLMSVSVSANLTAGQNTDRSNIIFGVPSGKDRIGRFNEVFAQIIKEGLVQPPKRT
jgi:hypothetical protein